jgi:hypothetical protein
VEQPRGLFRAHVAGRAQRDARLREVRRVGRTAHRLGDPEIRQHGLATRQQDVLGLDVAMQDALRVGVIERRGDPADDLHRAGRIHEPHPAQQTPQ